MRNLLLGTILLASTIWLAGCGTTGTITASESGISAPVKMMAEQNMMRYSNSPTSGTVLEVYGDSGQSITALGLAAIGTFGGAATAGAPGAVAGGAGGALLGKYMDSTTSQTSSVQQALKYLPAVK